MARTETNDPEPAAGTVDQTDNNPPTGRDALESAWEDGNNSSDEESEAPTSPAQHPQWGDLLSVQWVFNPPHHAGLRRNQKRD